MRNKRFDDLKNRIKELQSRINAFEKAGGDIYAPKRQLPYYEYMSSILDSVRKENPNATYEDIYLLCGIKFDREYNHFKKFTKELRKYVSDGKVDAIRTNEVREKNNVYEILKNYADKYNTMPFDFLYLMTGYYFSDCYIRTDYLSNLQQELLTAYPNRDITGIRWERPDLYEKIRSAEKYMPTDSKKSIIESLGFRNTLIDSSSSQIHIDENRVIDELKRLYPNKVITNLHTINPQLYNQLIKLCRQKGTNTTDWTSSKGFDYPLAKTRKKLAITKTDTNERLQLLSSLKQKQLEKIAFESNDEIDLFRASLKTTLAVIEELNEIEIKNSFNRFNKQNTEIERGEQ